MSTSDESPVLLLQQVEKQSKLQLHPESLKNVVAQVGELPVSILSFVGTSPQNRNLVVGYVLTHLSSICGRNSPQNSESKFLHSFLWKDGHIPDSETAATWIFQSPIIIKRSNNEEIAVVILYTQLPTEYANKGNRNIDAIIGLNILISSISIIDCWRQISQKLLQRLEQCIAFGIDGAREEFFPNMFQNLSFLVRDWNYPIEYPYGDEGGKKYLKKVLSQNDHSKKVKKKIKKNFETYNCDLIPFPGAPATSPNFTGKFTDLDPSYVKFLQNFIDNFLGNIAPSKIRGEFITGSSLQHIIETLINGFNEGYTPKPILDDKSKKDKQSVSGSKLQNVNSEERKEKHSDKQKKRKGSKVRLNSETATVESIDTKKERLLEPTTTENAHKVSSNAEIKHQTNSDSNAQPEQHNQMFEMEKDVKPKQKDDSETRCKNQLDTNTSCSTKPKDDSFTNEKIVEYAVQKFKSLIKKSIANRSLECISDADCKEMYEKAAKNSRASLRKKLKQISGEKDAQYKSTVKSLKNVLKVKTGKELESLQKTIQIKRKLLTNETVSETIKQFQVSLQLTTNCPEINEEDKLSHIKLTLKCELEDKLKQIGAENTDEVIKEMESQLIPIEMEWKKMNAKPSRPPLEFSDSDFKKIIAEYHKNMENALDDIDQKQMEESIEKNHSKFREECFNDLQEKVGEKQSPFYAQFSEEIEAAYTNFLRKYKAEQEQNEERKKEILSIQLQQAYANELSKQDENVAGSDEELKNQHKIRTTEILQQFKENCLYPDENLFFNAFVEPLKNKLNSFFQEHLNKLRKLRKERETNAQNIFDVALVFYENGMTQLLRINYFLETNELENEEKSLSSKAVQAYLDSLKSYNIPTSMATPEELLKLKFSQSFQRFKSKNDDNKKLSIPETKNLVAECLKDYNSSMSKGSVFIWNKETLENLHEESKEQAISNFHAKCVKKTEDFCRPYLQDLQNEIAAALGILQDIFEMKFQQDNDTISEALSKGRQVYNDEMDKHFKNHEFIKPETLENLHKDVSTRTVKFCFETNVFLEESHKLQLQEGMNLIFEKYEQQNNMNLQMEPAIGIDLGTTYCCVAIYVKGKIHIIWNSVGKNTTPSYVAFDTNGTETVGDAAKSRAYENPEATIFDAKRIIGRRFNDPNLQHDATLWPFTIVDDFGVPKILIGDKKLHPEEISAKLLKQLKQDAENYLQREVTKAVITVPAYFTDGQRQATRDAGVMAGFEVLNVQNEPTAAAIAYKLQHYEGREKNVLIFDLGGGTFDVAVLKMSKGNINVLAVDGDTHLGGEDFDKNVMNYCAQEFMKQNNIDLFEGKDSEVKQEKDQSRRRLKRLQGECERRKIELGTARVANVIVDRMHGNLDLSVPVTREVFEQMNDSLFQKTIQVVDKALFAAKLNKTQIDDIVLVGGSTRIPKVQELLINYFEGKSLNNFINPDEAVAYGAAMTAAYMNGTIARNSMDFNRIQDVTPMSIGVEVYGGAFSVIIPKSTKIPVKLMEQYRTAHNNQTSVQITIYQGEDKIAVKNQHLGDFYLNGIPPKPAEVENIDVEMVINLQGILHVSAVGSSTGQKSVSIIENKFRMGQGAIQRYLQEASI